MIRPVIEELVINILRYNKKIVIIKKISKITVDDIVSVLKIVIADNFPLYLVISRFFYLLCFRFSYSLVPFYICFCRCYVSYLFSSSNVFELSLLHALPRRDSAAGNYPRIKSRFHERMLISDVIDEEF